MGDLRLIKPDVIKPPTCGAIKAHDCCRATAVYRINDGFSSRIDWFACEDHMPAAMRAAKSLAHGRGAVTLVVVVVTNPRDWHGYTPTPRTFNA